jgi:F-type H+-transporting ATPase subunit a
MAAKYESPSEYIAHHLTFATHGGDGFMSINLDTMIVSVLLGFVGLGFFCCARATSGFPRGNRLSSRSASTSSRAR